MAENQNCSETPSNKPSDIRKNKLSTLSNVLKGQTSSIQHRACSRTKEKPSRGGFKFFIIKALIAGAAVYTTSLMGVWGDTEESHKLYTKAKRILCHADDEKIISDETKADLLAKMNKSAEFIKNHLATLPEDVKSYYQISEKFINDFINGKK